MSFNKRGKSSSPSVQRKKIAVTRPKQQHPEIPEPCVLLSTYKTAASSIEIIGDDKADCPVTIHFFSRNPHDANKKNGDRDPYTINKMSFPLSVIGQETEILHQMDAKLPLSGKLKDVVELTDAYFDTLSNLKWIPQAKGKEGHWKIGEDQIQVQLPKKNKALDTTMGCLLQEMITSVQTAYMNGMRHCSAVTAWKNVFSLIWLHLWEKDIRRKCIVGESKGLLDYYSCKLSYCEQTNSGGIPRCDSDNGSFDSESRYYENAIFYKQYKTAVQKNAFAKGGITPPNIFSKSPDLVIYDEDGKMVPKYICVVEIKSELEKSKQARAERQIIEYMLCHLHYQSKILGVLVLSTGFKLYKAVKNCSTKIIRIIQSQFSVVDDSAEGSFRTDIFKKFIHHFAAACEDINSVS